MVVSLSVFLGSVVLFTALSSLVAFEQRRGKRVFLAGLRGVLDGFVAAVGRTFTAAWNHMTQYVVRLGWYYSIHSFLRTLMRALIAVYEYLEKHFERNRARTKKLRAQKRERTGQSHLAAVAEHKAEVALSPEAEQALLDQKLEERD